MLSRLPGAFLRAFFVVLLIVIPSAFLPATTGDNSLIIVLVAIFCAVFTLVEYTAASPSLVEFRAAPPFNRLRFGALFLTVLTLSVIGGTSNDSSNIARFFQLIGDRIGDSADFPYSPVRLFLLMLPEDASRATIEATRTAAGLSYLISLASIAVFVFMLRLRRWPKRNGAFNVWVNLPTFDPTIGGDVVARLNRDSQLNLILGFLLPFLIPAIVKFSTVFTGPVNLDDPQTRIWMVTAWAFLSASLLMRGVALSRVAQLIHQQRKKAYAKAVEDGFQPA